MVSAIDNDRSSTADLRKLVRTIANLLTCSAEHIRHIDTTRRVFRWKIEDSGFDNEPCKATRRAKLQIIAD